MSFYKEVIETDQSIDTEWEVHQLFHAKIIVLVIKSERGQIRLTAVLRIPSCVSIFYHSHEMFYVSYRLHVESWDDNKYWPCSGLHCSYVVNGDLYFEAPDMRAKRAYRAHGTFHLLREWRNTWGHNVHPFLSLESDHSFWPLFIIWHSCNSVGQFFIIWKSQDKFWDHFLSWESDHSSGHFL